MSDPHTIWAVAQLTPGEGIEDGVARIAALLAEPRDCRTCTHHYLNIYENNACEEYAICTNADHYDPLPPVKLWRKS